MPLFSVVIPSYNRRDFLKKAVDSVLSQSFRGFELIICDDGSSDGTKDLISAYTDKRLRYIYMDNKGPAAARNRGIMNAEGEYVCFLDSDDRWERDKLSIHAEYIKIYPGYKIFHTQEIWYKNGRLLRQKAKHEKPSGFIFAQCLPLCCVSISTAVVHRSVFGDIGLFDEDMPVCEDYDFWLKASVKYKIFLIDKPLTVKDGGRPDQLSNKIKCMDRYRIQALAGVVDRIPLDTEKRGLAVCELKRKAEIYVNGCIKRNKLGEARRVRDIVSRLT